MIEEETARNDAILTGSPLENILIQQQISRQKEKEIAEQIHQGSPAPKPPFSPSKANDLFGYSSMCGGDNETPNTSSASALEPETASRIAQAIKGALNSTDSRLYDAFLAMQKSTVGSLTRHDLLSQLVKLDHSIDISDLKRFVLSIDTDSRGLIPFQHFFRLFETDREKINQDRYVFAIYMVAHFCLTHSYAHLVGFLQKNEMRISRH